MVLVISDEHMTKTSWIDVANTEQTAQQTPLAREIICKAQVPVVGALSQGRRSHPNSCC